MTLLRHSRELLLDYFVCAHQQRFRECQPERLGGGQIDCEIELRRLLDRDVGRLGAAKDFIDNFGSAAKQIEVVWPVGHQATWVDQLSDAVTIVNDAGEEQPPGTIGNIAFRSPDPVMMLEYWSNPEATRDKYADGWLITGDLGVRDDDGYFWFQGRADDVITSGGYRIGPSEIEDALARHPAVVMAAAIGVPDPVRTESIKAFVVLKDGFCGSPQLVDEIRTFVRDHLAKHEVPRDVEFVAALPMTTTGKIIRRQLRDAERAK
jgi:acyl-coenzyme A synthetase/AMP-(fatty) acid ligase